MTRTKRRPIPSMACLCLSLAIAACGGGSSDYETVGDAIIVVGAAYCDRVIECDLLPGIDRDQCEALFAQSACDTTNCNAPFEGDSDKVDGCADDLDDFSCTALEAEQVPPRCQSF